MGLFMALSGVIGAESTDVKNALSDFTQNQNGGFELAEGSTNDLNIGVITQVQTPPSCFPMAFMNGMMSQKPFRRNCPSQCSPSMFMMETYGCSSCSWTERRLVGSTQYRNTGRNSLQRRKGNGKEMHPSFLKLSHLSP